MAWLLVVIIIIAIRVFFPPAGNAALVALSVIGLAHAAHAFWQLGGNAITASGVYMLASGVFVYFPALYTYFSFDLYDVSNGFAVLVIVSITQLLMYYLSWKPAADQFTPTIVELPSYAASSFGFGSGAFLLLGGVIAGRLLGLGSTSLAGAASFAGVILVAVSLLQAGRRPGLLRILIVLGAFGVYVESMFSGGGRLVLGGLGVALALIVTQRAHSHWVKLGTIIGLPIGLLLLAANRSELVANTRGAAETGLESVVSPYARFGQLVELAQEGNLRHAFGETLLATFVLFVPRNVWPEKPVGFGAVLGDFFRPDLVGTGYSEAALLAGEWVWGVGIAGLFIMVPVTAWLIARADAWQRNSQRRQVRTRHDLFVRAATVIISAGVLDLFWGGTFLFAARGGQRLLVMLLVYAVFAWHSSVARSEHGIDGPSSGGR